jgi:hypothetical protein
MKEKKVGDVIVFDYDVYDVVNNIEEEYDHTDTLMGVVEEVIPDPRYTKYRVKLTNVINAESPDDYAPYIGTNSWIASDDKVYRGTALFHLLYPNHRKPTFEQLEVILQMYNPNESMDKNIDRIGENWYKTILGDLYSGVEFGEPEPFVGGDEKEFDTPDEFFRKLKEEIMKDFNNGIRVS